MKRDQAVAVALTRIICTIIGCGIGCRVFPQQTADQGGTICTRATLQTIRIATEHQADELNG